MNGLQKSFSEKLKVKINVDLPHVQKKSNSEMAIFFCSNPALNLKRKMSRLKTTRFFAPLTVSK